MAALNLALSITILNINGLYILIKKKRLSDLAFFYKGPTLYSKNRNTKNKGI